MAEENAAENEKRISVAKIYVKDFSFESPMTPEVFKAEKWAPQTNLNLRSGHTELENGVHEVVLTITVDAKEDDKTVFLVELQQAGLFELNGYEDNERAAITGSYCPSILFPYAREAIASVIQKGGFPEFVLQPINFDALYMQSQQQAAEAAAESAEKH
ncbi:MAG: protein-export chaperone SecB [Woeseiaceae bacterium]